MGSGKFDYGCVSATPEIRCGDCELTFPSTAVPPPLPHLPASSAPKPQPEHRRSISSASSGGDEHDHRQSQSFAYLPPPAQSSPNPNKPSSSPSRPSKQAGGTIKLLANKLRSSLATLDPTGSHSDAGANEDTGTGPSIWTSRTPYATDTRLLFKRKITTLYIALMALKSYVEVNRTGFRKILKK